MNMKVKISEVDFLFIGNQCEELRAGVMREYQKNLVKAYSAGLRNLWYIQL